MQRNSGGPIVHIGLGQTGTTSLQLNVFPYIKDLCPEVIYNDIWCMRELASKTHEVMTTKDERLFYDYVNSRNNFISLESLVDWNPRNWVRAADRNLRLFGNSATIIITVKETKDYLRSLYQQIVHQGNIWQARDFFINKSEYDKLIKFLPSAALTRYDVDSFNIEHLYQIYQERFSQVLIVPMSEIKELQFLKICFKLEEAEIRYLKSKFDKGKVYNRSYSNTAMLLTFKLEKLLNTIGLKTFGSEYLKVNKKIDTSTIKETTEIFMSLDLSAKFRQFPIRIKRRLGYYFKWRGFIQNIFDRIVPYKKFQLPNDVYLNDELIKRNNEFIEKISKSHTKL